MREKDIATRDRFWCSTVSGWLDSICSWLRILVGLTFAVVVLALKWSLGVFRRSVSELTEQSGNFTVLAHAVAVVLLSLVLAAALFGFLALVINPFITLFLDVFVISMFSDPSVGILGMAIHAPIAFLFTPSWCKLVVVFGLLPSIGYSLLLIVGLVFKGFSGPTKHLVLRLIQRSLEWKAGPVSFLVALLTISSVAITAVVSWWSK